MAGMPTNGNLNKKPENVQNSMTPTENTKWAEMLSKYKICKNLEELQSNNVVTYVKYGENYYCTMWQKNAHFYLR